MAAGVLPFRAAEAEAAVLTLEAAVEAGARPFPGEEAVAGARPFPGEAAVAEVLVGRGLGERVPEAPAASRARRCRS